ncbi:MAG: N-6 DNA methylase, partial [Pyrinomonadaceae bacterium]
MSIQEYIDNIARRYASGIATEHTFRGDLQALLESLVPEIRATNEPKRIECSAPDYVITRKDIPVGYIEAKDVGTDLDGKNLKEQFDRYRDALDNLVFTDYLDFRFFINGEPTAKIRIAEIRNGKIAALPESFDEFTALIKEFCSRTPQSIKNSKRLAEMMADKAKILAFIIKNAIESDEQSHENSTLREQMKAFKDILIHDIDAKGFADVYAQTIAYGMFAARLHDRELDTFSRQEAAEKIPKTNPFLRKLFHYIAGYDLDDRIKWVVDALADLFRATDIAAILKNFGRTTQTHDPIMHFYETFLAEYDPKLRKSRGVFYTPEPVVDFIVRAVDDILKTEFNLPQGLADTSKTKITVDVQGKRQEQEVHKVQILDPATGTGTFLASVIKHIYKNFENQQGVWPQYVDEHLIPRLNGFELLMASYAMAHLKLDLLLSELSSSAALPPDERKSYAFPAGDINDEGGSAADPPDNLANKDKIIQDSQEGGFTPALGSAGSGGRPAFPTASNGVDDSRQTYASGKAAKMQKPAREQGRN